MWYLFLPFLQSSPSLAAPVAFVIGEDSQGRSKFVSRAIRLGKDNSPISQNHEDAARSIVIYCPTGNQIGARVLLGKLGRTPRKISPNWNNLGLPLSLPTYSSNQPNPKP
jgi:hypothetical protein